MEIHAEYLVFPYRNEGNYEMMVWGVGAVQYCKGFSVEVPEEFVNNTEEFMKTDAAIDLAKRICREAPTRCQLDYNPEGISFDYNPKFQIVRILYRYRGFGIFLHLPKPIRLS